MGRTLSIVSGKGGVGKTTLTANLGIALAKRGFKVCLIDADIAMANLSLLLGMQSSPITLHDVLLGEATVSDAIYDGPSGVKFIPSGLSLENYRRVDSERLSSIVQGISSQFDYVLLDAPAGIEKNVLATIASAEEAMLVVTPDSPSIADALKIKMTAERLKSRPIGVIINLARGEKGEIKGEEISKILDLPVFGMVPYDSEVRRAFMQEKIMPFILRSPNSDAAQSIVKTASKLAGVEVSLKEEKPNIIQTIINKFSSIFSGGRKAHEAD